MTNISRLRAELESIWLKLYSLDINLSTKKMDSAINININDNKAIRFEFLIFIILLINFADIIDARKISTESIKTPQTSKELFKFFNKKKTTNSAIKLTIANELNQCRRAITKSE